jgi:hypothetical protein
MSISVNLSRSLLRDAKSEAEQTGKTISEQIEHWVLLGKALEENPDLSVQMLQDLLVSIKELRLNKVAKYSFG